MYYLYDKYSILKIEEKEYITDNQPNDNKPAIYLYLEEVYDKIYEEHKSIGDQGRDRTYKKCKESYANITKQTIEIFLKLCYECIMKKSRNTVANHIVKPIRSTNYLNRIQIDLIDCQSYADGEYRFILNIQDHFTKYIHLYALKTKTAAEVAWTREAKGRRHLVRWQRHSPRKHEWSAWTEPLGAGIKRTVAGSNGVIGSGEAVKQLEAFFAV